MEKIKIVEEERKAWAELSRRLNFFVELNCGSVNKELAKDAGTAFNSAFKEYITVHEKRIVEELGETP